MALVNYIYSNAASIAHFSSLFHGKLGRHSLCLNMFLVKYFFGNFFENELFPHIFLFNHFSIHTILNAKEEIYLETETPRLLSNEANDKNLI